MNGGLVQVYHIFNICQALCDPENQPHQWMNQPEQLRELLTTWCKAPHISSPDWDKVEMALEWDKEVEDGLKPIAIIPLGYQK